MPEESKFIVTFDHFTAYDLKIPCSPELWFRKRPTQIVAAFPYHDPAAYIQGLLKSEIFLGGASCTCFIDNEPRTVVSLLLNGLLVPQGRWWGIQHPVSPEKIIPLPERSDLYLPRKRHEPHVVLESLQQLFRVSPPSALVL